MSYYLYRFATWAVPFLPTRFGYWFFACVFSVIYRFASKSRRQYERNLRRVVAPGTTQADLGRIALKGFQNLGRNYFDLFRAHALSEGQLEAALGGVEGLDELEKALAAGKGVIGASTHFGNFNLLVHMVAGHYRTRYSIVVPMEHLKPEKMNQFVIQLRSRQGIQMIPAEQAGRALIKSLRAGSFIGLALDRDTTGTGVIVDFFGEPARLPDGAAQLALKYGCPIILGFTRRLPDNRNLVTLEPPVYLTKTGNGADDIRRGVECLVPIMEKRIRSDPEQWMMFMPVWEADKQS